MTSEAQSLPSDPPPRRPSADADETSYAPTPTQEAFWSMAALAPGRPVGNEALVFELRGPLDVDALRAAVDHLEARHDLWRTRLTPRAGALRAVVDPPTGAMLHVVDATGADDRARELERRTAAILAQPFDLAHEPAIRITLLRFAPDHHALVFTGHHALYDGVSFLVLMPQELARLYAAHRDGREVPVEEASFRAFAERERAELAGAPGREARAHWRRELADVPPPLELPADHRRPAVRSLRGARLERTLSREATDTLLDVERRAEVRRIDLLLATFAILLGRLGDRDDLTIGTAHANRRDPRNAELLGCLVRTLPIRASMTDRPTPAALAKRIRSARGRAFAHLEDVVDELLVERFPNDPSRHPGYQVVLNYMPFALEGLRFADLDVRVHRPDPGWTATDLSVDVIETSEGLRCVFEYDTGLFDEPTVRAWLDAFLTALEALPAGVDDPLDALPLLSAEARRELERLGDGDGPAARAIPITAELAAAAAQHADAVALVRGDRRITYRELWSRAGAIATRIAARPRPAEGPALVGIARSDPADALVAMVGALRAGVAYVPLDPDLPPRRLAQMLEDARPMAVIADAPDERFGAIPRIDPGAPHPGSDPRRRDAARADDPAADDPAADDPAADDPAADDPAYVIFTSGSTGRPKGVVVTHRNLVHENDARRAVYGPPRGPTLSAHAFAFDAAAACTYWALTGGGALVLLDADERRDPAVLRARIAEHGVRTLDVPPALYRLLLDGDPSPLRSLRTVIVGGEAVSPSLARTHRARLGDARLFDEYGPTETTVFSTVHEVGGGDADGSGDAIPIGRPIHRTRARICDAAGRLVVRGAMGELWLAGAGVSAGYLRRPEQTAAAFVEHPALGRTYRTGDRARWDGGGRLAFLGREDAQIQVQGHRVELREVEAALEALAGVARAAVVPRRTDGETRLHAYLVPLADAELKPSALRDALRSTLPAPMRPSTFTRIDALPLGPSGKVDVARLPPPSPIPEAPVSHWRHEPRTQAEDVLARAFRDALGTAPASVHDSFFDLGGTSLSAVRVLAALHRELGVRVPLSAFVRAPSIAGLADRLHREELLDEEPLVVVVHEGRDRPPFWLVHPVGGHVVFAERIAARWSPDQPLYGIQARGLDGRRPPIRDMDTMADLYVRLIRRAQPTGPYFVGGPSQGGLVALEIAQRLRAQGETVGMLAMLDCWAPGWEPRRVGPVRHVLDHLDALRDLSWRERLEYLQARWRRRLDRMQSEWMEYRIGDEADRGPIYDTLREVERANEELADAYTPRPYPGRIHLFRAVKVPRSPGLRFDDPTLGWSRWAKGGVVVVEIDSAHHTMLDEPGVDLVARQLEHHLRRAQARAAGDQ